jgi:hypothetical protein
MVRGLSLSIAAALVFLLLGCGEKLRICTKAELPYEEQTVGVCKSELRGHYECVFADALHCSLPKGHPGGHWGPCSGHKGHSWRMGKDGIIAPWAPDPPLPKVWKNSVGEITNVDDIAIARWERIEKKLDKILDLLAREKATAAWPPPVDPEALVEQIKNAPSLPIEAENVETFSNDHPEHIKP